MFQIVCGSFLIILLASSNKEVEGSTGTLVKNSTCYNGATNVNIELNSKTIITICFNSTIDNTCMASHTIHGGSTFEISNNRPSFKENVFYPTMSADEAYSQTSQLITVTSLVGSSTLGATYIDPSKSFYFARGHLAPDGDFALASEQNATYYFINVVPQWQVINNGNWKAMEIASRNYAIRKKIDLNVWTGGLRVLKLIDTNMKPVEIYLAKDSTGLLLPVPEITWKVIQDPVGKKAIAIFMINNPHLTTISQELLMCPDICSQLPWVTWQTSNITKGYTFCCEMAKAKAILPMVPNLGTVGLLV